MNRSRRRLVMESVKPACNSNEWELIAAHVRTTHLHSVISAAVESEEILARIKERAGRDLVNGLDPIGRRRWIGKGSRRFLWTARDIPGAIDYVLNQQGEPLETYLNPKWKDYKDGL